MSCICLALNQLKLLNIFAGAAASVLHSPQLSPLPHCPHSDSLKSNHVQATHKANNCETSGKSKSESESAQLLQLQERCVFGQRAASSRVSFGFLGNIPNSNPGPVSGFFFVARFVWFLDNAREQKIPFCIPFWDLENCQNHQRCVAPQLSMASWQEIVKCSGAGNKTQIQKEKPHMGNGKKGPTTLRVVCENATQLTATRCTFHTLLTLRTLFRPIVK